MFSVSESEALMPEFQPLMNLVQLRKQEVDVAKLLAGGREGTIRDEDLGE